jgi:hypothetical protein
MNWQKINELKENYCLDYYSIYVHCKYAQYNNAYKEFFISHFGLYFLGVKPSSSLHLLEWLFDLLNLYSLDT